MGTLSLTCALVLAACGDDDSGPRFVFDGSVDAAPAERDAMLPGLGDCPAGTEWVYLLDHDQRFIRFEPDSRGLSVMGTLSCPAGTDATPFSMGIGRDGLARVLYNDGQLFLVSLEDLGCTPTGFVSGQMGFELFGMGYSADALGSREETLFIGGGPLLSGIDPPAMLGSIDSALLVSSHGGLSSLPELSGTGNGDLWGFFPDESPMEVRQIDKTSGATLQRFDVSQVGDGGTTLSYAFAYWGGRFYIFYKSELGESSSIWALTTDLGSLEQIVPSSGFRIVGAGVSTCAPVMLI